MIVRHLWLVPVISVAFTVISVFSGYIVGGAKKHLPFWLPFISDGGAFPPEGCLFAQFLNMASFFAILTFYIRHNEMVEYYEHRLNWKRTTWRNASLALMCIGFVSAIGATMVANFPNLEVPVVHLTGASILYLGLLIYGWGHVIMGYALVPRMVPTTVNHFRLVTVIAATIGAIFNELAISPLKLFVPRGAGVPPGGWRGIKWFTKDSPFYLNHMVATGCEWLTTLIMQMFVLSFVVELRYAYMHTPRVIFRRSPQDDPLGARFRLLSSFVMILRQPRDWHIEQSWSEGIGLASDLN